jgi:hypothetical protein
MVTSIWLGDDQERPFMPVIHRFTVIGIWRITGLVKNNRRITGPVKNNKGNHLRQVKWYWLW